MRLAFFIAAVWGALSVVTALTAGRLLERMGKHYPAAAPAAKEVEPVKQDALAELRNRPRKRGTQLPGWRANRWTGQDKARAKPFQSRRKRGPGPGRGTIEEFATRDERNEFYRDLKAMKVPGICKMTTQRENKIVWQVWRP